MAWTEEEPGTLLEQRLVYRRWIRDIETGNDSYMAEQRELGEIVEDPDRLDRYRRNVAEIEQILTLSGVPFDA